MTKKAKLEQFDELKRNYELYMLAMSDVLNGDVEWSSWIGESGGGKYRVGWAGKDRANLGAMIVLFRFKGQRDSVGCFPWDSMFREVRESSTGSEWASIIRQCCYELQGRIAA